MVLGVTGVVAELAAVESISTAAPPEGGESPLTPAAVAAVHTSTLGLPELGLTTRVR